MDTNRYAPPATAVADLAPVPLKRRGIVAMILFTVITLGFYSPIWFLRRREALNQLHSPRKLRAWPFAAFIAIMIVDLMVNFAVGFSGAEVVPPEVAIPLIVVEVGLGIVLLMQCFRTKNILEDHLAGRADVASPMFTEPVRLSGLMTFIFTTLYLQYIINKHIATKG